MNSLIGQSIGRYHIIEQLGEGGMATVYKAYDTRLERDVAVKIIRKQSFPEEQHERLLKRFEREAQALARLSHPNIVNVMDYGDYEGAPYLVMPYLPGGTLKTRLGRPMPWQEAVKLLLPVAEALDYAHSQSIVHRDVKPSNILLTQRGQPMLTDFGIAKLLDLEEGQTLTGTGIGVGTPEYMAPEQWTGRADARADIYSLGVVLYELVTGRKPFTADTPAAILLKQANDPLPPPSRIVANLPKELEKIIFKALAKKPEDRYESMARLVGVVEDLQESGKNKKQKIKQTDQKNEAIKKAKSLSTERKTWLPWGIGICGILLSAAIVIFLRSEIEAVLFPSRVSNTSTLTFHSPSLSTITPTIPPTLEYTIGSAWERTIDGMVMVYVPEGEFMMGSMGGAEFEKTEHQVYLDGYWIDRTEVTNAMYSTCVEAGICEAPADVSSRTRAYYYGNPDYADYPVIQVKWFDAEIYCEWAGGRLPTEAEWEMSARGTDGRIYPWGDQTPTPDLANIMDWVGDTSVVGSYPFGASPYGVLDLVGNVDEYVADYVGEYPSSPVRNPTGPSTGMDRMIRGGDYNWYDPKAYSRFVHNPYDFSDTIGFRCSSSTIDTLPGRILEPTETTSFSGGSRIAFSTDRDGNREIYSMMTDGSEVTNLTNNPGNDYHPAWSPDGSRIAFTSEREGNFEIYVMEADGSGVIGLVIGLAAIYPAWSPDGSQIAFVSYLDGNAEIYKMEVDGSGVTRLTDNPASDRFPTWSPDGRQIAFQTNRDGNNEIYVLMADGSGVTNLTNNLASDTWPAWSPDGKQIAFSSDREGNSEIYAMEADGSGELRLTNTPTNDFKPAWSPDRRYIAFISDRDGNWEIYLMLVDGSAVVRLTNDPGNEAYPSWSPTGASSILDENSP